MQARGAAAAACIGVTTLQPVARRDSQALLALLCLRALPCSRSALPLQPNKPRGGKFARKNFKRKANRAAAEAGIVPGSAEDNDPSKPWYKKPRAGAKDKAAQADKDAEFDPSRVGESKWKMSAAGGGFMVEAPDCPKFEEYYREQGIIAPEEWPAFLAALRTKLPTTFRLSTINGMHYHLLHTLQNELQCTPQENQLGAATSYTYTDGQTKVSSVIDPPTPLAWYPNSLGWYLKAGKSELKTRGNKFAKFRSFLMAQYDQGNLNRQEAVSMIPPLLLDVQPKHMVLDMCAAPGSKTAQLIEGLHGGIHYTDTFATPEGMVIANDADTKRAYLLVHQLKRYGSSAFLVTTHDGQQFPNIYRKDATTTPAGAADAAASSSAAAAAPTSAASSTSAAAAASFNAPSATQGSTLVEFDRILCDVPCSGDGTMRKNINLWRSGTDLTIFARGCYDRDQHALTFCACLLSSCPSVCLFLQHVGHEICQRFALSANSNSLPRSRDAEGRRPDGLLDLQLQPHRERKCSDGAPAALQRQPGDCRCG